MQLGIDASNLRAGGGVTHLVELLRAAHPAEQGFGRVTVWGGSATLRQIPAQPWLTAIHEPQLDSSLAWRAYWQRVILPRCARDAGCDVLWAPGGTYLGSFRPAVTMSRNMLPFEASERRRYGWSWMRLKLWLLEQSQTASLRQADGVIYLTRYAQAALAPAIKRARGQAAVIPHGVSEQFRRPPPLQRPLDNYSTARPFQFLYVSTIDLYKHQWHVVAAVAQLRQEGFPIALRLIGAAYPPALRRLQIALQRHDPAGQFVQYSGNLAYGDLAELYHKADAAVFASSCENMPNVLLESMAAGLPIACAKRGPMPEVLGDAGVYFDPEQPTQIAAALRSLMTDVALREPLAHGAYGRALAYSWPRCAAATFNFMARIAREAKV